MTRDLPPRGKDLEAIYERRFDMVYRVCFLYMRNQSDTEDAVSTVFVKLLEQERTFDSEEHEKAWLIVTAQNVCKNELRRKRRRHLPIESAEGVAAETAVDAAGTAVSAGNVQDRAVFVLLRGLYVGAGRAGHAKKRIDRQDVSCERQSDVEAKAYGMRKDQVFL